MAKDIYSARKSMLARIPERKSAEELNKESEELYLKKLNDETQLLQAYNDKKLKSKTLIRKAKALANKHNNKDAN